MTMINYQSTITLPSELVKQWVSQCVNCTFDDVFQEIAQWGADQELEACCEWLASRVMSERKYTDLRAARRPKPPSLKQVALEVLEDANLDAAHHNLIRRALEQLDD